MQGDPDVVALLNEVLTAELTSINQYFVDAKMLEKWGYDRLAEHYRHESIEEMRDADELIERILYLEGVPNLQRLGTVRVGESPVEKLQLALELEREAVDRLNTGVALCMTRNDHGSRDLLAKILVGEEEHADWLETQQNLVAQLGETQYLGQQLHD